MKIPNFYSVIVPVYNGEKTVRLLYEKTADFFHSHNLKFELIFVHDKGPDRSLDELINLQNENNKTVKLIRLTKNFGQHNATICGIANASGNFIITMDEDLQHNPFDIAKLINTQNDENYDVVYGKYDIRKHSKFRNLGSSLLKFLIQKGIPDIHKDYSSFRLIKNEIAQALPLMQNSYTFMDGYISWITAHCGSCVVSHNERIGGHSSYDTRKLIQHTINIFVTFSNFPLKLLTKTSIFIFFINLAYTIYILYRKLTLDDFATGYPSLIIAIGFGVSLIMLSLGIIGEYLYRINLKTTKKPNYFFFD